MDTAQTPPRLITIYEHTGGFPRPDLGMTLTAGCEFTARNARHPDRFVRISSGSRLRYVGDDDLDDEHGLLFSRITSRGRSGGLVLIDPFAAYFRDLRSLVHPDAVISPAVRREIMP